MAHVALPFLVSTFANTVPTCQKTSGSAQDFSVHILFCDWQRGASLSTMMQLSPPWEFNMLYH